MKKIFLIFLTIILIFVPLTVFAAGDDTSTETTFQLGSTGDEVARIQTRLRELGYFNYRTTGKFSDMSFEAAQNFQVANSLPSDGQIGLETLDVLFSTSAKSAKQNPNFKTVYGPYIKSPDEYGSLTEWSEVSAKIPDGTTFVVQDLYSDKSFSMTRCGGVNCMVAEPASGADADTFIAMAGGSNTWEKRAVLVKYDGNVYAASILCSLEGLDGIADNGVTGSTQIFFSKSASDIFGMADVQHDTSVLKAAGQIV